MVGGDTAMGANDYSVAQFLSKTKLNVPLVWHSRQTTTVMVNEIVPAMERIHDITGKAPVIALERNFGGAFEMDRLSTLNRAGKFKLYMEKQGIGSIDNPDLHKYGYTTSSATRPKMLEDLKQAIDTHALQLYDEQTINELFSFIVVQTSSAWKAQAEKNAHDDLVMALAIAWQMYQTEREPVSNQQVTPNNFSKYRIG